LTYVLAILRWSDKHPRAKDILWAREQTEDLFKM